MAETHGVMLCAEIDLEALFGAAFRDLAPDLRLTLPEGIADPSKITFALAWHPGHDDFAAYPNLRAIFSIAAGTDRIMACPSRPADVPVFRVVDDDQADQMAGFAAFHTIWHHRQMAAHLAAQARAAWDRPAAGRSPAAHGVGVMGFGHLGRRVARALVALGYPVRTLVRRLPDVPEPGVSVFTDRAAFLAECQTLINLLPLTDATAGILNAGLFAHLPRGAALIHLGRGAQLNDADLLAALATGHLSGASLDVFATEPLPPDHPFWVHPRIFVTPHTAAEAEAPAVVRSVQRGLAALG